MKYQMARITRAFGCLAACWLWAQSPGTVIAQASRSSLPRSVAAGQPAAADPAAGVFSPDQVFRLEIEIAEPDMDVLRGYHWDGRGGEVQERPSVRATVREGTNVYRDVAVHLKGSAGSFRSIDNKPGLTLNFGKHTKGQSFHGLERLSLNNSVQDPTYLSEQICRELYAAAGVPVPRATHARVQLNQRNLGLYVLLEAYNKQFLRRSFTNDSGHLYDGGFVRDITDGLEVASGANPEDRSDLNRLTAAATARDSASRLDGLGQILDLDRFLSLLAMDVVLCNSDGYAMNRNNYRIYHDPGPDRLVFMPHGLDQMLGTFRCDTSLPIFPRVQGLVARAVWQTPEGRRRYRERLSEVVSRHYDVRALTRRVQQLAAKIRPVLTEQGTGRAVNFDLEVEYLKERITERGESLRLQLGGTRQELAFDKSGIARLDGWKSGADFGKPMLLEFAADRPPTLHISISDGSAAGAWTTEVRLEPGKYRFEGRLRCKEVVPQPGDRRGGTGLRTGSGPMVQKVTGNSEWTDTAMEFEVTEPSEKVELRCELRGIHGEVWFDRQSLRLRRE